MSTTDSMPVQQKSDLFIPLISAFLIVMYFAYIDEGYYDFRWMADAGNWIAFAMYMAVFFAIQWSIYKYVLGFLKTPLRQILMLAVVTPGVAMLVLWLLF